MKLTVENLGVISKAEVDLSKDLIIFTGENNTGKTYLAYLIYFSSQLDYEIPDGIITERILNLSITNPPERINLIEIYEDFLKAISKAMTLKLSNNLHSLFSTNKINFSKTKIEVKVSNKDISKEKILNFEANFGLKVTDKNFSSEYAMFYYKVKNSPSLYFSVKRADKIDLDSKALNPIEKLFLKNMFLIPAERQGINLFHKELSLIKNKTFDSLLQNGSRKKLLDFLQTRFNRYPIPIKDSLEFNQNLDSIKKEKSEFAYLADELEMSFLQGNVQIDDEGDIAFKPKDSGKTIEFHLTSSTVKSLSSLSIYLRYIAKKGDFIIIDEPELNLHPDNQRKIARFISRLIHEGFKVMISTHSDYIIRELNNLIMLGSSLKSNPEKTRQLQKKYKYKNEELLPKEKVGVYLFKQNKPVKKVRVSQTGFDISTIDKEVEKLNQSSQDILFSLFD